MSSEFEKISETYASEGVSITIYTVETKQPLRIEMYLEDYVKIALTEEKAESLQQLLIFCLDRLNALRYKQQAIKKSLEKQDDPHPLP